MKKIFLFSLILLLSLNSCGRKGPIENLPDEKRPKFDGVVDET